MYRYKLNILLLLALTILAGCTNNRFKIDIKKSDLQINIERFDKDVFALDIDNIEAGIPALQVKYGEFFDIYTQQIMRLGSPDSSRFFIRFRDFLTDSVFRSVYEESLKVFADVSTIEKKLTVAFKYAEHYFPEKNIPRFFMHVSGFNEQIVVTENALSVSIDDYLGSDFPMYKQLVYDYQLPAMTPQKVPSDYVIAWLMSEFPQQTAANILLDYMLYWGKIMFVLETFMPDEKEETLMAYSPEQLKWCKSNAKAMWVTMAEEKHLFSNDRMVIAKYINEAPFTSYFPQESPGRAGVWIGWQVIRSYMKNNQEVTLPGLMADTDYSKILEKSRYRP